MSQTVCAGAGWVSFCTSLSGFLTEENIASSFRITALYLILLQRPFLQYSPCYSYVKSQFDL